MTWSHPKMSFPQRVQLLFGSLSPSKFDDKISSFADPGSWILDPNFFHSGSWIQIFSILDPWSWIWIFSIPEPGSRVHSKEINYFNQKNGFSALRKMIRVFHPGFESRIWIPDLDPDFLPTPDPDPGSQMPNSGIIKAPDPWSQILDPDSKHWRFRVCSGCRV